MLINVGGLEQMAVLLDGALLGINPHNGDPQWQVPFKADYSIAVATPVWGPDNLLFISSEYNAGTKVIELKRNGLQTTATELWSSNRLRLHHGNAMRIGETFTFQMAAKAARRFSPPSMREAARFTGSSDRSRRRRSCGPTRSSSRWIRTAL